MSPHIGAYGDALARTPVLDRARARINQVHTRVHHRAGLRSEPRHHHALWIRTSRPAEELYDTVADPYQIRNLAGDPAHRQALERLRRAVTDWMARIGDQGLINEAEMIQRMWPGGVQPETAQPYIVPRSDLGAPSRREAIALTAPTEVVIYVPTQGASVAYTTEEGPAAKWRLYTGPIRVDAAMTLRAKAIRYGFKESAETRTALTMQN